MKAIYLFYGFYCLLLCVKSKMETAFITLPNPQNAGQYRLCWVWAGCQGTAASVQLKHASIKHCYQQMAFNNRISIFNATPSLFPNISLLGWKYRLWDIAIPVEKYILEIQFNSMLLLVINKLGHKRKMAKTAGGRIWPTIKPNRLQLQLHQ